MTRNLVGALLCATLACGGGQTQETTPVPVDVSTPPAPPPQLTDYLPSGTMALATIDVARARQSPYYSTVTGLMEGEMGDDGAALLRLAGSTSTLHVAVGERRGRLDVVAVAFEGNYRPGEVVEVFQGMSSDPLQETPVGSLRGWTSPGNGLLVDVEDGRWAVYPPEDTHTALEPAPLPLLVSPEFAEAASLLQHPTPIARIVGVGHPLIQQQVVRETPMSAGSAAHLRAFAASLDASSGVSVEGYAVTDSPQVTSEIATFARAQIAEAAGRMEVRMMGLAQYIERIEVVETPRNAGLRLSLTDQEVRDLVGGPIGQLMGLTAPTP